MAQIDYGVLSPMVRRRRCSADEPNFVSFVQFHGELVGRFVGHGFGFGGEIEDEALQNQQIVGGARAEFEVGAGYEADGAGSRRTH
jgi:hypothetical protein